MGDMGVPCKLVRNAHLQTHSRPTESDFFFSTQSPKSGFYYALQGISKHSEVGEALGRHIIRWF